MRSGMDPQVEAMLAQAGITTAWMFRMDFLAETLGVWTGPDVVTPTMSGDLMLDGITFQPVSNGLVMGMSANRFTYEGSDPLELTIGVPQDISTELTAANANPTEWQGRPITIWRALLSPPSNPLDAPVCIYRRIRVGSMDEFSWTGDGTSIQIKLTVESFASMISNASGMTYQNQRSLAPNDNSQDYAVSIANGNGFQAAITNSAGVAAGPRSYGDVNYQ